MTEQQRTAHTEDLALDGEESGSIVGGRTSPEREIEKLEKEGFRLESCTPEGTMMFNPHTKKHHLVKI